MYNYIDEMVADIHEYILENITIEDYNNIDDLGDALHDLLFCEDTVTGNASGSYFCTSSESRDAVCDNMDILREALEEFCTPASELVDKFLDEDWEYFDVTIRCYLLGQAIVECLDIMKENGEI